MVPNVVLRVWCYLKLFASCQMSASVENTLRWSFWNDSVCVFVCSTTSFWWWNKPSGVFLATKQMEMDVCRQRFVTIKINLMEACYTQKMWTVIQKKTTPPHSSSPSSALLKSLPDTWEWWTSSLRWPFSLGPLTLVHVDETEMDEDLVHMWVSGRMGGWGCHAVTQWNLLPHLQFNFQPGKLNWAHEASWVAYVTEPKWTGWVHDYNTHREHFHDYYRYK